MRSTIRNDLAEREHRAVERDDVELAEPGPEVPLHDLKPAPREVLAGEPFTERSELLACVASHGSRR